MKHEETFNTSAKTALDLIKSALLAFVILIGILALAFAVFLHVNSIPTTSIDLASVARDTSFYVGANQSQSGDGVSLSIRAVGQVDDSTATIYVAYPNDKLVAIKGSLMKGRIDQLWVADFYDRRAKITFVHNTVQRGNLHLQVHFSYPPDSWGYQQTSKGWVKAKSF